ncbi:hypothetical protein B5F25_20700, partial [Bacteroides sp. An19]
VPAELRTAGLTVSFINSDGDTEKWEFSGGSWAVGGFEKVGAGRLGELSQKVSVFRKNFLHPTDITKNDIANAIIAIEAYASTEKLTSLGTNELYLSLGYYEAYKRFYIQCDDVYPFVSPLLVDIFWDIDEKPTGIYEYTYSDSNFYIHLVVDTDIITSLTYTGCKIVFADMKFRNDFDEKINTSIEKLNDDIYELRSVIGLPSTEKELSVTSSNYQIDLNTQFKSGQKIRITAESDRKTSFMIAGNVDLSTSGRVSPGIQMNNGTGELELQYDEDGVIGTFGFKTYPDSDFDISFKIYVADAESIVENIEELNKAVENLNNSNIIFDADFIPSINDNPINHILRVPGYTAIFRDWGFIGDSLCSGEFECYDGSTKKYIDKYEYSWGQQICRLCGADGYNFSQGGQTVKGWISGSTERT